MTKWCVELRFRPFRFFVGHYDYGYVEAGYDRSSDYYVISAGGSPREQVSLGEIRWRWWFRRLLWKRAAA